MKKIVNFMSSVYVNRPQCEQTDKRQAINFWCPTGMTPVKF